MIDQDFQVLYEGKKNGSEVSVIDNLEENRFYRTLTVKSPRNEEGVLTIGIVMKEGKVQPVILNALVLRSNGSYSGGEYLGHLEEWMGTHWKTVKDVMPESERNKWLPNLDNPIAKKSSERLYLG
jgi:hypothetical protein